jgi:NCS1 family nucleobase:cation symporter-1
MPVSWLPLVADYSRLSVGGAFSGTFIGYFISSSLFYFVGGLSNAYLGMSDPIAIIATYGLGIPALLIIVLSTTTTTFLDIYSAAITFKNMRPKESLNRQVLIVGLLGTLIALIFPMEEYEWFLLLIGGAFIPLASIMITDYYVVCRGKYLIDELVGGKVRNVRVSGIASWVLGFITYMLISVYMSWLGATLPSMLITSAIYYILSRWFK